MDRNRRNLLRLGGVLGLSSFLPACSRQVPALEGATMGSGYRVQPGYVPSGVSLPRLQQDIESILAETESLMSLYRRDSELARINAAPGGSRHSLSPQTLSVVNRGLDIMRASGGAYHPAVGKLVDYWGFGPTPALQGGAPPRAPTADAMEVRGGFLHKHAGACMLDFNAIAKGDAVDRIADTLLRHGMTDYLVEIGGEIHARGRNGNGDFWHVGIEHPDGGVLTAVRLDGKAVATSGDYVHYRMQGDRRISHLVDPRSGQPLSADVALVSVVAEDTAGADAWATALMVMGPQAGPDFAAGLGMAALFLVRSGSTYRSYRTPAFRELEVPS